MPFGPWCWERLRAKGEEGIRGWDGWMASPMQWKFGQTSGDGEEQRGLACCSPLGHKKSGTMEWLNKVPFTATITWQCKSMTGIALKEELKERERGRRKEGDSVRGRRSPRLHTLSSSQDPLFPLLLDTERCPWRSYCSPCYSVSGHLLPFRSKSKDKGGKRTQ